VGIYDDEDGSGFGVVRTAKLGSATHLNWHVGEIHVTNPDLRPDTPRSNLELDSAARVGIDEIRSFYEECITDSRARAVFNPVQDDMNGFDESTSTPAAASALLEKLHEHEDIVSARKDKDKVKNRLRELLATKSVKDSRKKLIDRLTKYVGTTVPVSDNGKSSRKNGSEGKSAGTGGEPASGTHGGAKPSASSGATAAVTVSAPTFVDGEQLLSDVFAAMKGKIGSDEDLFAEVCQEIENVFKQHGLVDA